MFGTHLTSWRRLGGQADEDLLKMGNSFGEDLLTWVKIAATSEKTWGDGKQHRRRHGDQGEDGQQHRRINVDRIEDCRNIGEDLVTRAMMLTAAAANKCCPHCRLHHSLDESVCEDQQKRADQKAWHM